MLQCQPEVILPVSANQLTQIDIALNERVRSIYKVIGACRVCAGEEWLSPRGHAAENERVAWWERRLAEAEDALTAVRTARHP